MSLRSHLGFALAAALLVATFCLLGLWQRERATQKERTLQLSAEVLASREPLELSDLVQRSASDLAWVHVDGEFSALPPLLLDNQLRNGRAGIRVYRVFEIEPDASPLLVDLGWLPLPASRELPTLERPVGRWNLEGLLAPPPSAGLALGPGIARQDAGWLLTRLDPDTIATATGLSRPLPQGVLRLAPEIGIGYERDFDLLPNSLPPERHLGYSVQWFALAAAVLLVYLGLTWRSIRSRNHR